MTAGRSPRIEIPRELDKKLEGNRQLKGEVLSTLADFEVWLADNKLAFFPEYTDHGPDHICQVIQTASSLISDRAQRLVTAEDAALIILTALLHDCAMHLSEDGFIQLVTVGWTAAFADDPPWPVLWESFVEEASRFDGRKLNALFGDADPVTKPRLEANAMTRRDRLLIGEFLRRHHPRLAHEIAIHGVPGPTPHRLVLHPAARFRELAGHVARSHGMDIRAAVDKLADDDRRVALGTHPPFVMALLRIADYLQVQSERAPTMLMRVRSLRSPVSQGEWQLHHAIESIEQYHNDPEAIYIKALPQNARDFVRLRRLFRSIQRELDESWALLGETYGRFVDLSDLTLTIRRIRSSIDDVAAFARKVQYVPAEIGFSTAGGEMLKLLVGPLYGGRREIALREIIQNSLDAVHELRDFRTHHLVDERALPAIDADVAVTFTRQADGRYWLTVQDRGIGMTQEIIRDYFLRAGATFRKSDAWRQLHLDDRGVSRVLRSGRFGVGVLAAFLLGDHIEVNTRHASMTEALTFRAGLDDSMIEISRAEGPIGTTIKVPLHEPPPFSDGQIDAAWDWYCLADPTLSIHIDGRQVSRRRFWPGLKEPPPAEWRRLHPQGFKAIDWSYWTSDFSLACNGIEILDRSALPSIELPFRTPALSVFDSDDRLVVNLQRTNVVGPLSFASELVDDIVHDLIAFTAVNAPVHPAALVRRNLSELQYPGLASDDRLSWVCSSPHGWSFWDPSDCSERTVLLERWLEQDIAPAFDFEHTTIVRPSWFHFGTGTMDVQNVLHHRWQLKHWLMLLKDELPWTIPGHPAITRLPGDYLLVRYGDAFTPFTNFDALAEMGARSLSPRSFRVVEACMTNVPKEKDELGTKWRQIVRGYYATGAIPFALNDRKRLMESNQFRTYVESHKELARQRNNRKPDDGI